MKKSEIKELSNEALVDEFEITVGEFIKKSQGSRGTKAVEKDIENLKKEIIEVISVAAFL